MGLKDIEKLILSFFAAASIPWLIVGLIGIFFDIPGTLRLLAGLGLMAYFLIGGAQKNREYEESIATFFGSPVEWWIIPGGLSWWFPSPIGGSVRKTTTEKRTLDRSVTSGKPFMDVKTRDGATVEAIGVVQTWGVTNLSAAAKFTEADLVAQVNSLLDRNVRLYALYFDSDERIDNRRDSALANRKRDFSLFLSGENFKDLKDEEIYNDTKQKAEALGITIFNTDVVDVIEPEEVRQGRNRAAAEQAQSLQELLDIQSVRNRTLELMWGTSDLLVISAMKAIGVEPLMPYDEALRTVRAARGDLEDINVGGSAGDFSKGAGIGRSQSKRKK